MRLTLLILVASCTVPTINAGEAPVPIVVKEALEADNGLIVDAFVLAVSLPESSFVSIDEALGAADFRLTRLRPYETAQGVRVAAVWKRTSPLTRHRLGMTAQQLVDEDARQSAENFARIDVAGYIAPTDDGRRIRHAGIWVESDTPVSVRTYCEVLSAAHADAYASLKAEGWVPHVLQQYLGPDEQTYIDALWRQGDAGWRFNWDVRPEQDRVRAELDADYEQLDVALSRRDWVRDPTAAARKTRQALDARLTEMPASRDDLIDRGIAYFWSGNDESAIRDLSAAREADPAVRRATVLRYRAMAHARAGRSAEAAADVEAYSNTGTSPDEQDCLRAVVAGLGAQVTAAMAQLDAVVSRDEGNLTSTLAACRAYALLAAHLTQSNGDMAGQLAARAVDPLRRWASIDPRAFELVEQHKEFDLLATHPRMTALRHECGYDHLVGGVWHAQGEWQSRQVSGLEPTEHLRQARAMAAEGWEPVSVSCVELAQNRTIVASLWKRRWPEEVLQARALWGTAMEQSEKNDGAGAAATLQQVIELRRRHLGLPHAHTREALRGLANVLAGSNRLVEAVETLLAALESLDAAAYPDATVRAQWQGQVQDWLESLANTAVRAGDWRAAATHADRRHQLAMAHFGAEHWRTRDAEESIEAIARRAAADTAVQADLREADDLLEAVRQMSEEKRYAEATASATRSQTLRLAHCEAGSRDVFVARIWLGHMLHESGQCDEAVSLLQTAIADRRAAERTDDPLIGSAAMHLCAALIKSGNVAAAVNAAREAVNAYRQCYGENHAKCLDAILLLAVAHYRLATVQHRAADYRAAAASWEEAAEAYVQRYDSRHPDTREALWRYGQEYGLTLLSPDDQAAYRKAMEKWDAAVKLAEAGNAAEAQQAYEEVLTRLTNLLGTDAPDAVNALIGVASLHAQQGDAASTSKLLRQAVGTLERELGLDHEDTRDAINRLVATLNNVADGLVWEDRSNEVEEARAEVLSLRRKQYAEDHWRVIEARVAWEDARKLNDVSAEQRSRLLRANALWQEALQAEKTRDWGTAVRRIGQALDIFCAELGPDHNNSGLCVRWMAQFFLELDNPKRALQLLSEEARRVERRFGPSHPEVAARLRELGQLHRDLGELPAAADVLRRAMVAWKNCQQTDSAEFRQAVDELAEVVQAMANAQEQSQDYAGAAKSCEELAELLASRHGPADYRVADARLHGKFLQQLASNPERAAAAKKYVEALTRWQELSATDNSAEAFARVDQMEAAARAVGSESRWLADSMGRRCVLLIELKRWDEAMPALEAASALYARVVGPMHPETLSMEMGRAFVAEQLGDWAGAAKQLEEVVKTASELPAGDATRENATANLLGLLERWARQQDKAGDFEAAATTFESAARTAATAYGQTDYRTVNLRIRGDYYDLLAAADATSRERLRQAEALRDQAWNDYQAGRLKEAIRGCRESRDKFLAELTADHPFTSSVTFTLAWMSQEAGDYRSAEALHRESLAAREKSLPPDHVDRAYSLDNLGWLLRALGEPKKAEQLHRQALDILTQAFGSDSAETANTETRLGVALQDQHELDEAEACFRRAAGKLRGKYGERRGDTALIQNNLALLAKARKQFADAEQLLRSAESALRDPPAEHKGLYALVVANLGQLYLEQERYSQAEPYLMEALCLRRMLFGDDHPDTAMSQLHVTQVHLRLGQAVPAEMQSAPASAAGMPSLGAAEVYRSQTLAATGKLDQAVDTLRATWDGCQKALGPDHPRTIQARNELVLVLDRRAKKHDERDEFAAAAADFQEVIELLSPILGSDHRRLTAVRAQTDSLRRAAALPVEQQAELRQARADERTAEELLTRKEPADALRLLRQSHEVYSRLIGRECFFVAWGWNRMGNAASLAGQTEEAESSFRQAIQLHEQLFGRRHELFAQQLIDLGDHHRRAGDHVRAEPLFQEALTTYRDLKMTEDANFLHSLRALAEVVNLNGDDSRARRLLLDALQHARTIHGEHSSVYADVLTSCAEIERELGNFTAAFDFARRSVDILTELNGEDDPDTTHALTVLGGTFAKAGYLMEAESTLRDVIARRTRHEAADHESVREDRIQLNDLLSDIGQQLFDRGRYADSVRYLAEVESLRAELFGADHWRTIDARTARQRAEAFANPAAEVAEAQAARSLAQESQRLDALGKFDDAIRLRLQALAVLEPFLGAEHPDVARHYDWLARAHRLKGDQPAAEAALRKAVAVARKSLGNTHPTTASYLGHLALVRANRDDFAEALRLRREAVDIVAAAYGPDSPEAEAAKDAILVTAERQVDLLRDRGSYAEAAVAATAWQQLVSDRHGPTNWRTADAEFEAARMNRLANLPLDDQRVWARGQTRLAESIELAGQSQPGQASTMAQEAAECFAATLGEDCRDYALAILWQGVAERNAEQLPQAQQRLEAAVELLSRTAGPAHPLTSDCRACLADVLRLASQPDEAAKLYEQACRDQIAAFGPDHERTGFVLTNMVDFHQGEAEKLQAADQFDKAGLLQRRLADALARLLGGPHWRTVSARVAAESAERRATLSAAGRAQLTAVLNPPDFDWRTAFRDLPHTLAQFRDILEQVEKLVGPNDPITIAGYQSLARIAGLADEDTELLYAQRAETLAAETWGRSHPEYAHVLHQFADVVAKRDSVSRAVSLMIQARDILKRTRSDKDEEYGGIVYDLAWLRLAQQQDAAARREMYAAADVFARLSQGKSLEYANCLAVLGGMERVAGNLEQADALLRQALAIFEENAKQPDYHDTGAYAEAIRFRAMVLEQAGRLPEAAELHAKAYERQRETFGEQHRRTTDSLAELAVAQLAADNEPAATDSLRKVLAAYATALQLSAKRTEEDQSHLSRKFKSVLDTWLELMVRGHVTVDEAYESVVTWKGCVFTQQQTVHRERIQPVLFPLLDELDAINSQLGAACFAPPDTRRQPVRAAEQEKLQARRQQIIDELSAKSEPFRRSRERQEVNRAAVQRCLPTDAAIVDFVAADDPGGRVLAFVLRKDRPPAWIDLGEVKELADRVDRWRDGVESGTESDREARELKQLTWAKLVPHLSGVKTVLVSPDGPLTRLPFAALPGDEPGTYLIESELAFAVVPAARLLPELLATEPSCFGEALHESLLVVGGVDFGANPGEPADRLASLQRHRAMRDGDAFFPELQQTGPEADDVVQLFKKAAGSDGTVVELRRAAATEGAFRKSAGRHAYYHFATHGFEHHPRAIGERQTGLDRTDVGETAVHPGRLCGIALAGANVARERSGRLVDDGILTALEVADMDFSATKLVTLSACETGLAAEPATGEGVLGMQRAFHVAGARTCVAALWKVKDNATRVLMGSFYRHLWLERLAPLDALKQAQLELLRDHHHDPANDDVDRAAAGSRPLQGQTPARLPPRFWAAFVLSGDWR